MMGGCAQTGIEAQGQGGTGQVQPKCFDVLGLITGLVGTLSREQARDGFLHLDDINRILDMVRDAGSPLVQSFIAQEQRCRAHFRPSVRHATSRNDVFHRLMVRPFETLLEGNNPAFPRCFLPNYFELVEAAFADKFKQYDDRSREIFQDMLVSHGNSLAWDVFFDDPRSRAVLRHALHRLMLYLETPAGQWAWVTCMSRQNMDGAQPSTTQADMILAALRTTWKVMGPPTKDAKS